jgi:ATP-binding cassette, subfamily B, bacterial MsbA
MDFIVRLWRYVKVYKLLFVLLLMWALLNRSINMAYPLFTKEVIDKVIINRDVRMLHIISISLFALFLFRSMIISLQVVTSYKLQHGIIFRLRNVLYHKIQQLSLSYFEREQKGPIVSKVMSDIRDCNQIITTGFITVFSAMLNLIGATIILVMLNWKMAIITMLPIPFIAFLIFNFNRRAIKGYRQQKKKRADVLSILQENIFGIREIKTFTQEQYEMNRFAQKGKDFFRIQMHIGKLMATYHPLIIFFSSLGTVIILWYGGFQVIDGSMSIGTLVAFVGYLGILYAPIEQLNHVNNMFQSARTASERIFEVIDMAPEIKDSPRAIAPARSLTGDVIFENVSFHYEKPKIILSDISLHAQPGERIAIVGPSGSGKTTLISLIPRFYDTEEGRILIDDRDIKDYKLFYLRSQIGMVLQESFIFNGTVAENIAFGKLNATREEIIEVARAALAHNFIEEMSEGYDTEVGEQGSQLSGGQKQRIAIARALLKNPPILILDEATSSVDSETEKFIQEALEQLMKGRTSFIIAHRLSTIRSADRIIVLKDGKIVETGTHRELLEKGGFYFHLYQIQFGLHEIKDEIPLLLKKYRS